MITNIFSRSNPMNFLICISILLLAFIFVSIKAYTNEFGFTESIGFFSVFFLLSFSVFLTDFIAKKSNLNKSDNYAILFFTFFLLLIPETLSDFSVVCSNLFVLLAFRRLASLQSLIHSKQKIFDASIWISIASIFEFWSILFFVLVFVSILIYASNDLRNWLIPLVGVFAVTISVVLYAFIFDYAVIESIQNDAVVVFDFRHITEMLHSFSLAIFLITLLLFMLFQVLYLRNYLATQQNSIKKVLALLIIGLMVYLFSDSKDNSLLLYCMAPLSIIGSNFINSLNREWLKDASLYTLLVLSCISFYLVL